MTESRLVGIPADQLVLDPDVQARDKQDPEQIARLRMSDPQDWPPLLVTPNPDPEKPGTYLVIDGAHRFLAGQHLEGGKRITVYPCEVREELGYEDSVRENLRHLGLQLTRSDRLLYARFLHENDPHLSDREIGRRVGLHHTTIATHLAKGEDAHPPRTRGQITKLMGLLVRILDSGEGTGFLGLGNRASAVAKAVQSSRDPDRMVKVIKAWIPVLERAVEIAEADTG